MSFEMWMFVYNIMIILIRVLSNRQSYNQKYWSKKTFFFMTPKRKAKAKAHHAANVRWGKYSN